MTNKEIVKQTEGRHLEFKETLPENADIILSTRVSSSKNIRDEQKWVSAY